MTMLMMLMVFNDANLEDAEEIRHDAELAFSTINDARQQKIFHYSPQASGDAGIMILFGVPEGINSPPSAIAVTEAADSDMGVPSQQDDGESPLELLSSRELEIAYLVSDGDTNQQIARKLGLSHKTVETYLARIFKKLVVSCRAEVATIVGRSKRAISPRIC